MTHTYKQAVYHRALESVRLASVVAKRLGSTPAPQYHTVTVTVADQQWWDHKQNNGKGAWVLPVKHVVCTETGEWIRDHINVNADNNKALLLDLKGTNYLGKEVTLEVQWKRYPHRESKSGFELCFETVVSIAA